MPSVSRTEPATSMRGRGSDGSRGALDSVNLVHSIHVATAPSGRLTRKIQRHER